jgi:hypothetical protein
MVAYLWESIRKGIVTVGLQASSPFKFPSSGFHRNQITRRSQVPLNRDHTLPGAKEKKFAFVNFQVSMAAINVPKVTTSHLPTGTFVALSTSPSGYSRSVRNNLEVHCGTTMILYHHLNQCRGYEERKEER